MRTDLEFFWTQMCVISLTVAVVFCSQQDEIASDEVNLQPGGQEHSFQKDILKGVICKFTYSAQGGTNERWFIQVTHSKDNTKFGCSVHRPEGRSYLFFMSFKMEILGEVHLLHGSASGNSGPLPPQEFTVDKKTKSVSHVEGKFQSQLTQVEVGARKGKSEL